MLADLPAAAATALLVLLRCGPLVLLVPAGVLGRAVLLAAMVALLGPLVQGAAAAQLRAAGVADGYTLWRLAPLFGREALVGLTLALGALLPWAAARSAGRLIDAQLGPAPRPALAARLYGLLALALFFALGGGRVLCAALATSYALVPLTASGPGPVPLPRPAAPLLLVGKLLAWALGLALPVLAAQLLSQIGVRAVASVLDRGRLPSEPAARTITAVLWLACLVWGATALGALEAGTIAALPQVLRHALERLTR